MTTAVRHRRILEFQSKAFEDRPFAVHSVRGFEGISQLFDYTLELVSRKAELDFDALLREPATLLLRQPVRLSDGPGFRTMQFHGVLASFEQLEKGMDFIRYRARLVPRLWWLSLTTRCRIFLDKNVREITDEILAEYGLGPEDVEFRALSRPGPRRKYVVQYQETDLQFLSRLLENEGICYHFDHGYGVDRAIFGDKAAAFSASLTPTAPFRPIGEESDAKIEAVRTFLCRQSRVAREVVLRDYNPETPSVDLRVSAPVDAGGQGTCYLYGEHYLTQAEGKEYAAIRAEELLCRKRIFHGSSNVCALQAGRTFSLFDHYRHDFNAEYLVTELQFSAVQSLTLGPGETKWGFENEFTAIPSSLPFRPARTTPRPRISGTMHGHVDASKDETYAEIDKEGQYKVTLPFDLSGRRDGKASREIRMAQPYAGADYGMHFPLHKGTEVIVTHIDGDPDRPVIAGSVPNPEKKTPVFDENYTQCRIRTCSGNTIRMEDRKDGEQIHFWTPGKKTYVVLGQPHDKPVNLPAGASLGTEGNFSLQAKHTVTIGSGWYGPDESRDKTAQRLTEITNVMSAVAQAIGTVGDASRSLAGAGLDRAGQVPDTVGISAEPNTIVSALGRLSCVSGGTATLASASALDCFAVGKASLMSGADTLVASMHTVSIVAGGGEIDVDCHKGPVHLTSQTQDITATAHKNVKIHAKTEDVLVTADRNLEIVTKQGEGRIRIQKRLDVTSDEEIVLQVGPSTITMDKKGIRIEAPEIHVSATNSPATLDLGAAVPFQATSSGAMVHDAKTQNTVSGSIVAVDAKAKITGSAPLLDVLAVGKELHKQYMMA